MIIDLPIGANTMMINSHRRRGTLGAVAGPDRRRTMPRKTTLVQSHPCTSNHADFFKWFLFASRLILTIYHDRQCRGPVNSISNRSSSSCSAWQENSHDDGHDTAGIALLFRHHAKVQSRHWKHVVAALETSANTTASYDMYDVIYWMSDFITYEAAVLMLRFCK